MKKNIILLIFICGFFSLSKGILLKVNYFEYYNMSNGLRHRIDLKTHELRIEIGPNSWKKIGKVSFSDSIFKDLTTTFNSNFFFLKKEPGVYFTIVGSGMVFLLDTVKLNMVRIDHTYNRGYNYSSYQFVRKDTIYSAGGYGFWNFNSLVTYYSKSEYEWDLVTPDGKGPETILAGFQGYDPIHDIYFSGCSEKPPVKSNLSRIFSNYFYCFNFKTNTWEFLGEKNPKIPFPAGNDVYFNGHYFIFWASQNLYILDPTKNEAHVYNDGKTYFTTDGNYWIRGDSIRYYWQYGQIPHFINLKYVLKYSKYIGPFYSKGYSLTQYILIIASVFSVLFLIYILIKRKKNVSNPILFDSDEKKLLNAFFIKGEGNFLTTQELNTILNLDSKSLENQRKLRLAILTGLNFKIQNHFQIENAINRQNSAEDKRLNIYNLKKEAFLILSKTFETV